MSRSTVLRLIVMQRSYQNFDFLTKGLSVSIKGAYDNRFNLTKSRTANGWRQEYQRAYYKSYLEDPTKPQTDPDYDKTIVYIPASEAAPDYSKDQPLNYSEND